jgi:hypothetical protein
MVDPAAGESEARLEIVRLKVGHLIENLSGIQSRCEKIKDIANADAHTPNARTAPALVRVKGDAIKQRCHSTGYNVYCSAQAAKHHKEHG